MVTVTTEGTDLVLEVQGLDKLWSLRSRLVIPLAHVRSVRREPDAARRWFQGFKLAGSHIPGVLTAGTFYQDGKLVFWDVHDPEKAVAFELRDERYERLIVEVEHPDTTVREIASRVERAAPAR
ncbi:MAG TPA: hypothetical protein VG692_13235 [Gemmatimonadales bacterium]|nr:hypothetical protein [Gemmatimonadales bacterium]